MDNDNLKQLQSSAPANSRAQIGLLLNYSDGAIDAVPDPYFGNDDAGFERVLDLVEDACENLLKHLVRALPQSQAES